MKNKGFTLVELLATVVVLGIIMVIAIPNVTGITQKNRAKTYYEDAKKLVTLAEYKMRGDSSVERPTGDQCLVMNLYYLDNSEFENPPNGGTYDKTGSFVVIKRVTAGTNVSYSYHVRLLENVDGNYRGISFIESSDLYKDVDLAKIKNVSSSGADDSIFIVDTTTGSGQLSADTNIDKLGNKVEADSIVPPAAPTFVWDDCGSVIGNYAIS